MSPVERQPLEDKTIKVLFVRGMWIDTDRQHPSGMGRLTCTAAAHLAKRDQPDYIYLTVGNPVEKGVKPIRELMAEELKSLGVESPIITRDKGMNPKESYVETIAMLSELNTEVRDRLACGDKIEITDLGWKFHRENNERNIYPKIVAFEKSVGLKFAAVEEVIAQLGTDKEKDFLTKNWLRTRKHLVYFLWERVGKKIAYALKTPFQIMEMADKTRKDENSTNFIFPFDFPYHDFDKFKQS